MTSYQFSEDIEAELLALLALLDNLANQPSDIPSKEDFLANFYQKEEFTKLSTSLRAYDTYLETINKPSYSIDVYTTNYYSGTEQRDDKGVIVSRGTLEKSGYSAVILGVKFSSASYEELTSQLALFK